MTFFVTSFFYPSITRPDWVLSIQVIGGRLDGSLHELWHHIIKIPTPNPAY